MRPRSSHVLAALPGAAAIALWGGYRHAVNEFLADQGTPARLPGRVRVLPTDWGRLFCRYVAGSHPGRALVLVHGLGSSADSVWWKLIQETNRTVLAIDLPGHGRSTLKGRFTFHVAAEAIKAAVADAGLTRPILVGHSMGGPVALTAIREWGVEDFGGFVAVATSAYWVRPRHRVMVAAAPYLFAPTSPIVTGAMRAEVRRDPETALQVERRYAMRPNRRVLAEAATELRRFDARKWADLRIPESVWIVTTGDSVIHPDFQRASAGYLGVPTVDLASDHRAVTRASDAVAGIIEDSFERVGPSDHIGGVLTDHSPR